MQEYTLPQLEAFVSALDVVQRKQARSALIVARAARANPKAYQKIIKEFS